MGLLSKRMFAMLMFMGLAIFSGVAKGNNVYISQNGGTFTGGSACNGQTTETPAYFNTAGNWTSGTPTGTQIGPGTTVHLCGIFTGTAGSTILTFQGSGAAGSPITLRFESGAQLTAPYWNNINNYSGAVVVHNVNYVVIDGGTNQVGGTPLITATANGTGLANQQPSCAIFINGGNNVTVQNMTISPMYVHLMTPNDTNGDPSNGIYYAGPGPNITFSNNYVSDASSCLTADQAVSTMTNVIISGNTTRNCRWHIRTDGDNGNGAVNGVYVYGNDMSGWENWATTGGTFHLDGAWFAATTSSSSFTNGYFYNNYVHGYMDGCVGTAFLYVAGNVSNSYIFNNVWEYDVGTPLSGCGSPVIGPGGGLITFGSDSPTPGSPDNVYVYNNTFYCTSDCVTQGFGSTIPNTVFYNNIAFMPNANGTTGNSLIFASSYGSFESGGNIQVNADHNNWYYPAAFNQTGTQYSQGSPFYYQNFVQWQGNTRSGSTYDRNSNASNTGMAIDLNSSSPMTAFTVTSGSPAVGLGVNFYSTCHGQPNPGLGALCEDSAGSSRPPTGGWDAGAYNYVTTNQPAPPTNLTAVSH